MRKAQQSPAALSIFVQDVKRWQSVSIERATAPVLNVSSGVTEARSHESILCSRLGTSVTNWEVLPQESWAGGPVFQVRTTRANSPASNALLAAPIP
jgi:hypothetical protein